MLVKRLPTIVLSVTHSFKLGRWLYLVMRGGRQLKLVLSKMFIWDIGFLDTHPRTFIVWWRKRERLFKQRAGHSRGCASAL